MKLDRQKYLESRSIKPSYILIALIAVNLVLGALALVFPEQGLALSKNLGLKFWSKKELFDHNANSGPEVDIDNVLIGLEPLAEDSLAEVDTVLQDLIAQVTQEYESAFTYDSLLKRRVFPKHRGLQLGPDSSRAMDFFFASLMNEADSHVVRVLHYGDSQLEGDRISDYFRNRMQLLFGGKGPGIVLPLEPTAGARRTAYVRQSPNIIKHAIYKKGSKPEGNFYGIGAASFQIQGFYNRVIAYDTIAIDSFNTVDSIQVIDTIYKPIFEKVEQSTAYVKVSNAKSSYPLVRQYDRIRFLYSADEPFTIDLRIDTTYKRQLLPAKRGFGIAEWNQSVQRSMRLDVVQGKYPLLYGFALDGYQGVAVDNFPMRGSAALGFSSMNRNVYGAQLSKLNVRLIILQYGVNVIPSVLSDYTYYERMLRSELKAIKQAYPDVSILVIGPSDMSRNKGGQYVSYSNIPLIRDAMRNAAFETGCAFWDLYEAMGGENSMAAWVERGYAGKDYTHFSGQGAKFVGEMLYNAIMEQLHYYNEASSQDLSYN